MITKEKKSVTTGSGREPQSLQAMDPLFCRKVRGIFTDIDDTLSWHGKISAEAYQALWLAKEAGLRVIPVTGRPAGWVDHIVRMWPVDMVIGENGAFYFYLDSSRGRDGVLCRRFLQRPSERKKNKKKLREAYKVLRKEMPHLRLASDQRYRAIDLAVDYCEDVEKPLTVEEQQRVVAHFEAVGAQVKVSSIHINAWIGDFDKLACARMAMQELGQEPWSAVEEHYLYCGDSPNDEPFFQAIPHTVGVANVRDFLPRMQFSPRYITEHSGGLGFAELVRYILRHR